jgi:alkylated DNA repair dioxygenase AlkB
MSQHALFPSTAGAFAKGYVYEDEFLSVAEETDLLNDIRELPFKQAEYQQYLARRRIVSYGGRYDFSKKRLNDAEPIAPFLFPLRERVAKWTGRAASDFTHALVSEYAPGTPLGWHRDVPDFEMVVGISLNTAARMRFRRYPPPPRAKAISIELAPRSIYRLEGEARWEWQHSVPPTPALRYSITFRTLRSAAG